MQQRESVRIEWICNTFRAWLNCWHNSHIVLLHQLEMCFYTHHCWTRQIKICIMLKITCFFTFWQFFSSRRKFNPIFVFITRFVKYLSAIKENNWTENTIFNDALLYIWTLWQRMSNFSINKTTQLRMFVRVNDVIRWMRKGYICSFIIYHLLLFRLHF